MAQNNINNAEQDLNEIMRLRIITKLTRAKPLSLPAELCRAELWVRPAL